MNLAEGEIANFKHINWTFPDDDITSDLDQIAANSMHISRLAQANVDLISNLITKNAKRN